MDRQLFADRFAQASAFAREWAARYIEEPLPESLRFRVRLNNSYDKRLRDGETVYPEDSDRTRAVDLLDCNSDAVIDTLWRDYTVPEWINLTVINETGEQTVIEVVSCGRFTADDNLLYHVEEGYPPFHVLSPPLPPGHDGAPFSIHRRAECWTAADMRDLRDYAPKVWSIEVFTDVADADQLVALPDLPNVEILEHHYCSLGADALRAFARFERLRILRIELADPERFSIRSSTRVPRLEEVSIKGLPPHEWGSSLLFKATRALQRCSLTSAEPLVLDGKMPKSLGYLSLTAPTVAGQPQLPRDIGMLSLSFSEGNGALIDDLLRPVKTVRTLILSGTPVTEEEAESFVRRFDLDSIFLDKTGIPLERVERLAAKYPHLHTIPFIRTKEPRARKWRPRARVHSSKS